MSNSWKKLRNSNVVLISFIIWKLNRFLPDMAKNRFKEISFHPKPFFTSGDKKRFFSLYFWHIVSNINVDSWQKSWVVLI